MRSSLVLSLTLVGCAHAPRASSASDFKAVNVPVMEEGVPGGSSLGASERAKWCERLTEEALARIPLPGDTARRLDACSVSIDAAPSRQRAPGVHVVFSVDAFLRRPFAAASYDEATRTLFLPLRALDAPWSDVQATRHEWRHANIDAMARSAAVEAALRSRASGPRFKPDSFVFDEVLVNACDLVDADASGAAPAAWQRPMVESMLGWLADILTEARSRPAVASSSLRDGTTLELRGVPDESLTHLTQLEREVRLGLERPASLRARCDALLGGPP